MRPTPGSRSGHAPTSTSASSAGSSSTTPRRSSTATTSSRHTAIETSSDRSTTTRGRSASGPASYSRPPADRRWRATTYRLRSTSSSAGSRCCRGRAASRGHALLELAIALMRSGSFAAAEGALEEALDLARSDGDRQLELRTLIERAVLPDLHERGNAGGGDHARSRRRRFRPSRRSATTAASRGRGTS